jgi:catechol 2,3-dioxygenase-like lactoylglutathione lyase family enzyme
MEIMCGRKGMTAAAPVQVQLEGIQPILRVENMEASLRFYSGVLGFKNAQWGTDDFTSINHPGGGAIYLCRGDQGLGGAWLWIGVDDVGKLHDELKARGIGIRLEPTNYPWAREMHVEDPDGNVLRFGSDPTTSI